MISTVALKCIQTDVISVWRTLNGSQEYATLIYIHIYIYMLHHSSAEDLCDFNCHGVENGYLHVKMGIISQCKIVSPKVWNKRLQCETDLTFTIDIFYVIPTSERHFTCAVMKHLTFKFDLMCKLVSLPAVNQSRLKQNATEKLLYFIKCYY